MHRFIDNLRCKIKKQPSGKREWLSHKISWSRQKLIQQDAFDDVLVIFKFAVEQQKRIDKVSKIIKASPFLGQARCLQMDGRIAGTQQVSFDFRFSVILPKGPKGTKLLVDWYHRLYKHCNAETGVNEMRQRLHESEMRVAVKQAGKHCH